MLFACKIDIDWKDQDISHLQNYVPKTDFKYFKYWKFNFYIFVSCILSCNYSPASFAIMRINTRKINNQAGRCVGHVKSSNYFSAKSNTYKKSMYSITHYCYWRLQDVWEKAVRKAQDEAIGLLIFHKQSKITKFLPRKCKIICHVSSSTIIVFLIKS